jgi:hypothetical protein
MLDDHADAWQNYRPGIGPNDSTITLKNSHLRCPVKDGEPGNAAFFTADDWMGNIILEDVFLSGGGYTLRLHGDGASTVKLKNVYIEKDSWVFGPLSMPPWPGPNDLPTILQWENVWIAELVNGKLILVQEIPRPY